MMEKRIFLYLNKIILFNVKNYSPVAAKKTK